MAPWLQIVISLVAAALSLALDPSDWKSIRSEAMVVLAVMAAAVLFRLGRGFPSISIDELEIDEAQKLAAAFKVVARRLAFVAGVIAVGLFGLAGMEVGYKLITVHLPSSVAEVCVKAAGAALAAVIAFAFSRAVVVVLGDLSAIAVQSENMVKSVQRRHARNSVAAVDEAEGDEPFKKPSRVSSNLIDWEGFQEARTTTDRPVSA